MKALSTVQSGTVQQDVDASEAERKPPSEVPQRAL